MPKRLPAWRAHTQVHGPNPTGPSPTSVLCPVLSGAEQWLHGAEKQHGTGAAPRSLLGAFQTEQAPRSLSSSLSNPSLALHSLTCFRSQQHQAQARAVSDQSGVASRPPSSPPCFGSGLF